MLGGGRNLVVDRPNSRIEHPQGADARQCIFGTNRRFGDPSCDRSTERNAGGTGYSAQSDTREQLGQVMMGRYYYY